MALRLLGNVLITGGRDWQSPIAQQLVSEHPGAVLFDCAQYGEAILPGSYRLAEAHTLAQQNPDAAVVTVGTFGPIPVGLYPKPEEFFKCGVDQLIVCSSHGNGFVKLQIYTPPKRGRTSKPEEHWLHNETGKGPWLTSKAPPDPYAFLNAPISQTQG